MKEINNLIRNETFFVQNPQKGDPVTPCMDVYKAKIQSDGSLDKLKLRYLGLEENFRIMEQLETPVNQQIP